MNVLRAKRSNDRSRKRLKSCMVRQGAADVARLIIKFYKKLGHHGGRVGVELSMLIMWSFSFLLPFLLMYF